MLSEVECKQQAIASGLSDPSKVEKALQQTKVILTFFTHFVPRSPKEGVRAQDLSPFIGALLVELGVDSRLPALWLLQVL